jgi:hypothetical protein
VLKERATDAKSLTARQDIRVADQIDVAYRLDPHHADQGSVGFVSPERDAGSDLLMELGLRHVGLVPSVSGDDAPIGSSRSIDDLEDRLPLIITTATDPGHEANLRYSAADP